MLQKLCSPRWPITTGKRHCSLHLIALHFHRSLPVAQVTYWQKKELHLIHFTPAHILTLHEIIGQAEKLSAWEQLSVVSQQVSATRRKLQFNLPNAGHNLKKDFWATELYCLGLILSSTFRCMSLVIRRQAQGIQLLTTALHIIKDSSLSQLEKQMTPRPKGTQFLS